MIIRRIILSIVCFGITLLISPGFALDTELNSDNIPKRVLLLNSYHRDYKWTEEITSSVQNALYESGMNIDLRVEYMDTKRIYNPVYLKKLAALYRYKYRKERFDLIITSDNNALHFVRNYGPMIFSGVPVVFCGVNNYQPWMIKGISQVTGVSEEIDAKGIIDLILKLHPETDNILIIHSDTVTGRALADYFRGDIINAFKGIRINIAKPKGINELIDQVRDLSEKSVILYTVYSMDAYGRYYSESEVVSLIAKKSGVPLYGLYDFYLGSGILGGKILSASMHGNEAAELAIRILAGEKASEIPVVRGAKGVYMFDASRLDYYGVKIDDLPENSKLINRPPGFYQKYRVIISAVAVLALFQSVFVFYLLYLNRARLKAESQLRASNQLLEIRVAQRTSELEKSNNRLIEENKIRQDAEYALRESEEKMRAVIDTSPLGILTYRISSDGVPLFESANPSAERILGIDIMNRLVKKELLAFPGINAKELHRLLQEQKTERKVIHLDQFMYSDPLIKGIFEIHAFETHAGEMIVMFQDITERRATEYALRENEERLRTLFVHARDGIILEDEEGNVIETNPAAEAIFGFPATVLYRINTRELFCDDKHSYRIQPTLQPVEVKVKNSEGNEFPVELTLAHLQSGGEKLYLSIIRDITERKLTEAKLMEMATHDMLTGLPNTRYFMDALDNVIARAKRKAFKFCVLFIDLDGFKEVNDTLGHEMGDMLLKMITERFHKCVRKIDTIGRLGGDEFAIILESVHDHEYVAEVCERIINTVAEPFILDSSKAIVTASIGVSFFSEDSTDPKELVRFSDRAMYRAKNSGKNCFRFYNEVE